MPALNWDNKNIFISQMIPEVFCLTKLDTQVSQTEDKTTNNVKRNFRGIVEKSEKVISNIQNTIKKRGSDPLMVNIKLLEAETVSFSQFLSDLIKLAQQMENDVLFPLSDIQHNESELIKTITQRGTMFVHKIRFIKQYYWIYDDVCEFVFFIRRNMKFLRCDRENKQRRVHWKRVTLAYNFWVARKSCIRCEKYFCKRSKNVRNARL
eukprot:gb/GECH01009062.1/.p1 GENE.gb/GECH01009062.1/~~gb/GECH01009062.1/.p1  ORF type:complete len:208 (+),score=29.53 gb/GECH01009062.1/:1-624(+)